MTFNQGFSPLYFYFAFSFSFIFIFIFWFLFLCFYVFSFMVFLLILYFFFLFTLFFLLADGSMLFLRFFFFFTVNGIISEFKSRSYSCTDRDGMPVLELISDSHSCTLRFQWPWGEGSTRGFIENLSDLGWGLNERLSWKYPRSSFCSWSLENTL